MKTPIDEALEKFDVCSIYSLFSGGHDSLVATHLASQHPRFTGVFHIDTTTGLRETQEFVKETCKEHGWNLTIQKPFMPFTSLLMKYGFPGPAIHNLVYERLKNRTLSTFVKNVRQELGIKKPNIKVMLISGVRKQESSRRANIQTGIHIEGTRLWTPLISGYSAIDCSNYIEEHSLKRSPVKDTLHMSGECFCGCYSRDSELHELKYWYPYKYEHILKWRELVKMARDIQVWECEQGLLDSPSIKSIGLEYGGPKGAMPPEQMELFPMCHYCRGGLNDH